jgi:hypothetical protein
LSRANLKAAKVETPEESNNNIVLERKLLEIRNYAPDLSHILLEPVPLNANLSFLETSFHDHRQPEDVSSPPQAAPEFEDDELSAEDSLQDDDDAFP